MRLCAAAGRCRDLRAGPDGKKHAAPIELEHGLCQECTDHIRRRCVESWADDLDALQIMLGERQSGGGEKVRYTSNPAIPLSTDVEKLSVDLVFYACLAADMVSDHVGLESRPYLGKGHPLRQRSELTAAGQRVGPYLEKLLEVPAQPVMIWATGEAIDVKPVEYRRDGARRYVPLDAQGRQILAQGRVLVDMSGVDVALKLRDIHDLVRGLYGGRAKDQRDHMQMPCRACGNYSLYRDHGGDLIRCRKCPPNSEPGRGWTQEQYDRLAGLTRFHLAVREEIEMDMLKWLLAEVRWTNDCSAWVAAERLWHLSRAAEAAGVGDVEGLIAALDRVAA